MMNLNPIRERLHNGFSPFIITTTDGRTFAVPHPDYIAVGKGVVVVLRDDDTAVKIDGPHIVSIEDKPSKKRR
jgi:hypothetical protein